MKKIFVFWSNLAGQYTNTEISKGAILGQSAGIQNDLYAIPIKDRYFNILPINVIKQYISKFISYVYVCDLKKIDIAFYIPILEEDNLNEIAALLEPLLQTENIFFSDSFMQIYCPKKRESLEEKEKRNKIIVNYSNAGKTNGWLSNKFKLSTVAIWRILKESNKELIK